MNAADLIISDDTRSFADVAAHWLARTVDAVVRVRGKCSVALSGGATPQPVYEKLAAPPYIGRVPWSVLSIYFGDERCVPPTDPASNYSMAWQSLLAKVPLEPTAIHRMQGEAADRMAAARDYAQLLPAELDLLILGVGKDGHTASLFPGSPLLEVRDVRVTVAEGPTAPRWRLTITPPVIEAARTTVVLASGGDKADAVACGLLDAVNPKACPVHLAKDAVWILDPPAATRVRT